MANRIAEHFEVLSNISLGKSLQMPEVNFAGNASESISQLRRIRGGRHIVDCLARASDTRSASTLSKSLRFTRLLGTNPLPAYWWDGKPNFGDQLSPALIQAITGFQPILVSRNYQGKLLAAGSVLGHAKSDDVVWGAGLLRERTFALPPRVEVLAVRGPLSRQLIGGEVPEVYGDPALLLPDFFRPECRSRYPVGVVPHLSERDVLPSIADTSMLGIDVSRPWQVVVAQIASCELILSSSLHGIIIADAYGIPCVWIKIRGDIRGGDFKFRDYFASTNRGSPHSVPWDPSRPALRPRQWLAEPEINLEPLREGMREYVGRVRAR